MSLNICTTAEAAMYNTFISTHSRRNGKIVCAIVNEKPPL